MENNCNFLQGVCILQGAVEAYLKERSFYNTDLNEMLPADKDIKFVPYDAQADETAKVLISMTRGTINLANAGVINMPTDTTTGRPGLSIVFTISTQSYYLTEAIGVELLQYISASSGAIRTFNLNIGTIQLSETQVQKDVSPHFYINKIVVQASIPQIMWKLKSSDDILNSIRTNITFNGQTI